MAEKETEMSFAEKMKQVSVSKADLKSEFESELLKCIELWAKEEVERVKKDIVRTSERGDFVLLNTHRVIQGCWQVMGNSVEGYCRDLWHKLTFSLAKSEKENLEKQYDVIDGVCHDLLRLGYAPTQKIVNVKRYGNHREFLVKKVGPYETTTAAFGFGKYSTLFIKQFKEMLIQDNIEVLEIYVDYYDSSEDYEYMKEYLKTPITEDNVSSPYYKHGCVFIRFRMVY